MVPVLWLIVSEAGFSSMVELSEEEVLDEEELSVEVGVDSTDGSD